MLCDESHKMLEAYGVWGKKKFMGREYMGISRMTYVIDEQGIIKNVYKKNLRFVFTKSNHHLLPNSVP